MDKVTPRPFEVNCIGDYSKGCRCFWIACGSEYSDAEEMERNIVRAVNAHDSLVELLKEAICHIAEAKVEAPDPIAYAKAQSEWLSRAHKALNQAEGKQQ
jgi:hypothetical protein